VACPALQYLSHERHDFREGGGVIEYEMCFFLFLLQLLSEIFFILRRTERDMIKKMYVGLRANTRSCQILMKIEISQRIFEKYKFQETPPNGSRGVP
jgi:hypothetical protein